MLALGTFAPAAAQAAAPKTLYVSQGGLDKGTCTAASPCATVSYALTKAASGATIKVSGTIDDRISISSPVTITTWPGGPARSPAVLDGTGGYVVSSDSVGVTLDDLTIENRSLGIQNAGGGTLTLSDSTVSGNVGEYGGILNYFGSTMTIIDGTVTKNSGSNGVGGGIYNLATVTVIASTISGNTDDGIYSTQDATATLGATIVADNTNGPNCDGYDTGSLDSVGYNLTNDKTGTACSFTRKTDLANKNHSSGTSRATAARQRPCCRAPKARPPM